MKHSPKLVFLFGLVTLVILFDVVNADLQGPARRALLGLQVIGTGAVVGSAFAMIFARRRSSIDKYWAYVTLGMVLGFLLRIPR